MSHRSRRASIVIPAHDEGQVIERCLQALTAGAEPGEFEILVVANGCSDDTAERARRFPVTVIEVAEPSKANALDVGDAHATAFPRIYLDADVVLSVSDLRNLTRTLEEPGTLAAAPRLEVDLSRASLAVRAFYRIWLQHPYHREGMIGSGVYGLSRSGRERFDSFPRRTADDAFVHRLFTAEERRVAPDAVFRISAPRDLSSLIAIKTRSRRGNLELDAAGHHACPSPGRFRKQVAFAASLLARPSTWFACGIYAYVVVRTMVRARTHLRRGNGPRWERDLSSRIA